MIEFVIDASALIELTVEAGAAPGLSRRAHAGSGAAPELIGVESLQALRAMVRGGALDLEAAHVAAARLASAPIALVSHRPLLGRVWELRDTVSAYDATYVALAERLGVPLLTCDARLGRAHGHSAEIVVYPRS